MSKTLESRYGGGLVTPAQYITEFICEKKSTTDLPEKFWKIHEWGRYFRNQVASANALLKIYSVKAILRAINDPRAKKIYSLRAPQLDKLIQEKEKEIQAQEQKALTSPALEVKEDKTFTQSTSLRKKTNLALLKEVEENNEQGI